MSDLPGWLSALYRARADIETACEKIGQLDAENTRLCAQLVAVARERDEAEVRAGEMRMCVNCGKVRHAGEPKDDLPECTDPATGFAACTWDATPQEAWRYWRDEAHRKHESARAAEADAAAAREQVRKLREAAETVHSWIVCAAIATPEEMAESFGDMEQVLSAALQGEG